MKYVTDAIRVAPQRLIKATISRNATADENTPALIMETTTLVVKAEAGGIGSTNREIINSTTAENKYWWKVLASLETASLSTIIFLVSTLPKLYAQAIIKNAMQPYSASGLASSLAAVIIGCIIISRPIIPTVTPAARRQVKRSSPFNKMAPAMKDHIGTVPLKIPPIVGATKRCPQEMAANGSKISSSPMVHGRQSCLTGHFKFLR